MTTQTASDLHRTRLFNFAALSAWLVTSGLMALSALLLFGQDFRVYYAAARLLLTGGNPYDYAQLAKMLMTVSGFVHNNPFYYPPWLAWFFTPLALLPFQIARAVWILLNWIIWNLGLWQLASLLDWPQIGWRRWLMFLYATFLFAWITWRYEQLGIILFTLLPVAAICLWLVLRRRWQTFLSLGLVLIVLLLVSTALSPGWYSPLLQSGLGSQLGQVLDAPNVVVALRINTTLTDWLTGYGLTNGTVSIIQWLATLASGLSLLLVIFRSNSLLGVICAALLANFAVTPYALQYDYPLLSLPLFWSLAHVFHSKRGLWIGLFINAFIASVLIWERPISDGYWILLGLVSLAGWSWFIIKNDPIPPNLS